MTPERRADDGLQRVLLAIVIVLVLAVMALYSFIPAVLTRLITIEQRQDACHCQTKAELR